MPQPYCSYCWYYSWPCRSSTRSPADIDIPGLVGAGFGQYDYFSSTKQESTTDVCYVLLQEKNQRTEARPPAWNTQKNSSFVVGSPLLLAFVPWFYATKLSCHHS